MMIFAELEDYTGKAEAVVFAKVLEKNSSLWRENNIVLVSGKVNFRDQSPKILVEEAREINEDEIKKYEAKNTAAPSAGESVQTIKKLSININSSLGAQKLKDLKTLIAAQEKGATQVILNVSSDNSIKVIKTPYLVNYNPALQEMLKKIVGKENIRVE